MITGIVNPNREAVLRLKVQGPNGQEEEIEAVIDTGFTGELTLPPDVIARLGLTWLTQGQAGMANGQKIPSMSTPLFCCGMVNRFA